LQGATSGEAQTLELACTSCATAFESGDDAKDNEEVAVRNTLERELEWARHAFDKLILPTTLISFLLETCFFDSLGSLEKSSLLLSCSGQTLAASGRRRARAIRELRAERAQLEMQLVVARVAAAAAVASEASPRTSLEAARQSAEDRAITAQTADAAAAIERNSLVSRLPLAKAEAEKLRAAAASAEEAIERAKTATAATKTAARDAAQAAALKKADLEARVSELERDLGTAMTDLAMVGRQFSQITNQLQVVFEEATQLRESNASYRRIMRVSHVATVFLCFARCWLLVTF
jgi:chromosome segregation ATPase